MVLRRLLLSGSASAVLLLGGGGFRELGPKNQLRLVKMFDAPRDALKAAITRCVDAMVVEHDPDPAALNQKAGDTRVLFFRLSTRGGPTVIAQSAHPRLCTAERECPLWVFQRTGGEWAQLLDTEGRAFRVLPTRTNRYRDIAVLRGSATRIFRFNGTSYREH